MQTDITDWSQSIFLAGLFMPIKIADSDAIPYVPSDVLSVPPLSSTRIMARGREGSKNLLLLGPPSDHTVCFFSFGFSEPSNDHSPRSASSPSTTRGDVKSPFTGGTTPLIGEWNNAPVGVRLETILDDIISGQEGHVEGKSLPVDATEIVRILKKMSMVFKLACCNSSKPHDFFSIFRQFSDLLRSPAGPVNVQSNSYLDSMLAIQSLSTYRLAIGSLVANSAEEQLLGIILHFLGGKDGPVDEFKIKLGNPVPPFQDCNGNTIAGSEIIAASIIQYVIMDRKQAMGLCTPKEVRSYQDLLQKIGSIRKQKEQIYIHETCIDEYFKHVQDIVGLKHDPALKAEELKLQLQPVIIKLGKNSRVAQLYVVAAAGLDCQRPIALAACLCNFQKQRSLFASSNLTAITLVNLYGEKLSLKPGIATAGRYKQALQNENVVNALKHMGIAEATTKKVGKGSSAGKAVPTYVEKTYSKDWEPTAKVMLESVGCAETDYSFDTMLFRFLSSFCITKNSNEQLHSFVTRMARANWIQCSCFQCMQNSISVMNLLNKCIMTVFPELMKHCCGFKSVETKSRSKKKRKKHVNNFINEYAGEENDTHEEEETDESKDDEDEDADEVKKKKNKKLSEKEYRVIDYFCFNLALAAPGIIMNLMAKDFGTERDTTLLSSLNFRGRSHYKVKDWASAACTGPHRGKSQKAGQSELKYRHLRLLLDALYDLQDFALGKTDDSALYKDLQDILEPALLGMFLHDKSVRVEEEEEPSDHLLVTLTKCLLTRVRESSIVNDDGTRIGLNLLPTHVTFLDPNKRAKTAAKSKETRSEKIKTKAKLVAHQEAARARGSDTAEQSNLEFNGLQKELLQDHPRLAPVIASSMKTTTNIPSMPLARSMLPTHTHNDSAPPMSAYSIKSIAKLFECHADVYMTDDKSHFADLTRGEQMEHFFTTLICENTPHSNQPRCFVITSMDYAKKVPLPIVKRPSAKDNSRTTDEELAKNIGRGGDNADAVKDSDSEREWQEDEVVGGTVIQKVTGIDEPQDTNAAPANDKEDGKKVNKEFGKAFANVSAKEPVASATGSTSQIGFDAFQGAVLKRSIIKKSGS